MTQEYRVGNHQPRNIYRGEQYIGVMFSPQDAALVVVALNLAAGAAVPAPDSEDDIEPCGQSSIHVHAHRWRDARGIWHTCPGVGLPDPTTAPYSREADR